METVPGSTHFYKFSFTGTQAHPFLGVLSGCFRAPEQSRLATAENRGLKSSKALAEHRKPADSAPHSASMSSHLHSPQQSHKVLGLF